MGITRGELRGMLRDWLKDEGATVFSDLQLDQWAADALDDYSNHFPRELTARLTAAEGEREVSLLGLPGLQRVVEVEFPVGDDPPSYLISRCEEDPDGFYGWAVYDVRGCDPPETLVLGETPVVGQRVEVTYQADHVFPAGDGDRLTVPDRDVNLIAQFVRWRAISALEHGEAATPNVTALTLSQLGTHSGRARREYDAAVRQRKQFGPMAAL